MAKQKRGREQRSQRPRLAGAVRRTEENPVIAAVWARNFE